MRPKERELARTLEGQLKKFDKICPLRGIQLRPCREAFVEQLVESVRRVRYVSVIGNREVSPLRADASSDLFDPLRAAIIQQRRGNLEEAFWLVFLFVHFGRNQRTGWRLARDVYGALSSRNYWTWAKTVADPKGFRRWLATHEATLRGADGIARAFGNHRKYESLGETAIVAESYVDWVNPPRTHQLLVAEAQDQVAGDPRKTFDYLYRSMQKVHRFGRLARFDYLTMVGKLRLARIEPGSAYIQHATGPRDGARMLFGRRNAEATQLEEWLKELDRYLGLDFGMQVLEDALCNWQKSPAQFKPFRG